MWNCGNLRLITSLQFCLFVIMRKHWFSVTSLALFLSVECLYAGDSCVGEEERAGNCILLSECHSLLIEIRQAGTPMPSRLRIRLQGITCGFQKDEPLVCCTTPNTNEYPNPNEWIHGMGSGSPWQTSESTWNNPQPTPTLTPTSTPTTTPSTNNNRQSPSSGAVDITGHRNLKLLQTTNCGIVESDRIWGGNRTRLYEMPWMVLIAYNSNRGVKLSCGGTLITERYVLTAAHCVVFLGNTLKLSGVVLGEYDVRKDPDCERVDGELHCAPNVQNVTIEQVIAHPGYSPQNLYDDIALIRLAERADFTLDSMKPICLPDNLELQKESLDGMNGVVAGWGATEDGLQSPILLSVELPIVSNRECQDAYNGSPQIYERQICAGGVQDKDSCGGDSGGPLMYPGRLRNGAVRYVQRGIVSYGSKRCGIGGYPGVYTRVSHYMYWILDNIRS